MAIIRDNKTILYFLGKEEVGGSSPLNSSKNRHFLRAIFDEIKIMLFIMLFVPLFFLKREVKLKCNIVRTVVIVWMTTKRNAHDVGKRLGRVLLFQKFCW